MTPKEKAKELCDKFLRTYKVSLYPPFNSATQEAKGCALVAVDEILNVLFQHHKIDYWKEVKQEINKL